ncbi:large terminase [Arthronema virus TR020]|uniref:Large terminase n=1 Tax=Arthronema virus TR020 TaxID=2736280 RepID=A0A7G3WH55_9CAUD|nr:large terminase [Arthronema virus TR020]
MPKTRTPPTQEQLIAALTDIWAFADIIGFRGGKSNFGKIHYKLTDFLTAPQNDFGYTNLRRLILMPRGHLKSTVASVLYALWRVYRNPNIRIITGTNQKRLSRGFIRELRQYFEDDWLQEHVWNKRPHVEGIMVPALSAANRRARRQKVDDEAFEQFNEAADKKVIWGQEALQVVRPNVMKEPTIQTLSVGTVLTGDHSDLVILDDIVDFKNSDTQNKAETILDWTRDIESILDPRTRYEFEFEYKGKTVKFVDYLGDEIVVLGTRYYKHDYYGYMLENAGEIDISIFQENIYVNGENSKNGYIWEERFNDDVIANIQRRIKDFRRFASQYLNKVITAEEVVFDWEAVNWLALQEIEVTNGLVRLTRPKTHIYDESKNVSIRPVITVDPAGSDSTQADRTVIAVGGYDEDMNLYVLDYKAGNFNTKEILDAIFTLSLKWKTPRVYIETNGVGAYLPFIVNQAIKERRHSLLILEHRAKGEKKTRIQAMLEPYWNNGRFFMSGALAKNTDLMTEVNEFPSKGGSDDILDAIEDIAQFAVKTQHRASERSSRGRKNLKTYNKKYGGTR